MVWTNKHNEVLVQEMYLFEPSNFKRRRKQRGKVWERISESLNQYESPNSPGDIHFWIYYDVTDNGILDLRTMRPCAICKGTPEEHVKQKKDGVRLCDAEKDLPKVNSTVVFLMHSSLVEWSLNFCQF